MLEVKLFIDIFLTNFGREVMEAGASGALECCDYRIITSRTARGLFKHLITSSFLSQVASLSMTIESVGPKQSLMPFRPFNL